MELGPSIIVRHNIEVAHRLYEMAGKCENIHGHSMWIDLHLFGQLDGHGVLEGLEYGKVKGQFRGFLDSVFDHHLLLNKNDPWAQPLISEGNRYDENSSRQRLPGLQIFPGDPTTENIAKWIAEWARDEWQLPVMVKVAETAVNAATSGMVYPFSVTNAAGDQLIGNPQGGTVPSTTSGE